MNRARDGRRNLGDLLLNERWVSCWQTAMQLGNAFRAHD
jgi:hypothetical protein